MLNLLDPFSLLSDKEIFFNRNPIDLHLDT